MRGPRTRGHRWTAMLGVMLALSLIAACGDDEAAPTTTAPGADTESLEDAELVIYSGRRVPFARVDMQGAREIFIREALVAGQWETKLTFLAANQKLVRQVEELEHKSELRTIADVPALEQTARLSTRSL